MGRINESKFIYFLFLIICGISVVLPLLASYDLLCLDSYESFKDMLTHWYVPYIYFGRVVVSNLDYVNFSIIKLLVSLLSSLSILNYIILFLNIYLACAYDESFMKKKKYYVLGIDLTYILGIFSILFLFLIKFDISSVNAIMHLFKIAGLILMLVHLFILLIAIRGLYTYWKEIIHE